MKVLYDHQIFTRQKFGGISRYFYELIGNSCSLYEPLISGKFSENTYVKNLSSLRPFPVTRNFKGRNFLINFFNTRDSVDKIKYCQIFHPTYYDNYFINNHRDCKTILTVYDMIHEKLLSDKRTVKLKRNAIFAADMIIAISESTKNDLLQIYPELPPSKVKVIYLGNSLREIHNSKRSKGYILFTGQRGSYKNFENFIKAVATLLIKYNLIMKCTGDDFSKKEVDLFSSLGVQDRVQSLFATDEELSFLYANALMFVFPSLYEGFGIPVLEAFASGCPLVASNTSSLPEIGGDAAIYFDPLSIYDMRKKMEDVILSDTLQNNLIQKGYLRLQKFSWKKCAEETADVYRQVLV